MHSSHLVYEFGQLASTLDYRKFAGYSLDFLKWQANATFGPIVSINRPDRLLVIILSYKRVRNIRPIVRSLLKLEFVDRIVVSNNNPDYRIRDWVQIEDSRVEVIDQVSRGGCGLRWAIARERPFNWYLCIDDDVFLYPDQVSRIFERLLDNPDVPHGIEGELFIGESCVGDRNPTIPMFRHIWAPNRELDVINRVYAISRCHLEEFFRLAKAIGYDPSNDIDGQDDMVISHAGSRRPWGVDVRRDNRTPPFLAVLDCPSVHRNGIAVCCESRFLEKRIGWFDRLRKVKPLPQRTSTK